MILFTKNCHYLMDTNVTSITENHLVAVFTVRLKTQQLVCHDTFTEQSVFYSKQVITLFALKLAADISHRYFCNYLRPTLCSHCCSTYKLNVFQVNLYEAMIPRSAVAVTCKKLPKKYYFA